jgi:tRNA U34 2-thiouridine synthase MnmA/TrmU
MTKAVALLSGGLDSTLAVKLMIEQGIEVHALNFTSSFCTCNSGGKAGKGGEGGKGPDGGGCRSESRRVAEEFGIPIKVMVKGPEYMDIVRNPAHGYGKGINPCVDCRIYMFKLAKQYMAEIGASFIITGEVLGQRPMSQRKDSMRIIEKESGLVGYILRPLCAKHLPPTIPEEKGLVDRDRLLSMVGRSRRAQMDLAEELDVGDYPCPSGGCLLTDKIFSKKVRDLLDHKKDVTSKDLAVLKAGRHFRFNGCKVIVARNEAENTKLKNLLQADDTFIEPVDFPGPVAVVTSRSGGGGGAGGGGTDARAFAGSLILRYSSPKAGDRGLLRATHGGVSEEFTVEARAGQDVIEKTHIC